MYNRRGVRRYGQHRYQRLRSSNGEGALFQERRGRELEQWRRRRVLRARLRRRARAVAALHGGTTAVLQRGRSEGRRGNAKARAAGVRRRRQWVDWMLEVVEVVEIDEAVDARAALFKVRERRRRALELIL